LWAWGQNFRGEIGDGTVVYKSSPVQIGSLTTWSFLSLGRATTFALKTDSTLWAWGFNDAGQLGDGTVASRSSPIQVGLATNWLTVSTRDKHTFAITIG
jgi:alpha-tubulin suppressor-like RCC1 family protein